MDAPPLELTFLAAGGVVGGLALLLRGFEGYREAARITDTSTSRIATLAAGEVRVSGTVEPAEVALVSPLQSARCVFYRSSIERRGDGDDGDLFREERAVGFRVRDPSGTVRVFPRGAAFDVPARFDEATDVFGSSPAGLQRRSGSAFAAGEPSREQQIKDLLTVHPAAASSSFDGGSVSGLSLIGGFALGEGRRGSGSVRYREARIDPGDTVTVIGLALPFDQLPDPLSADLAGDVLDPLAALRDPEVAADLVEARAAGELAATPEEAWGNAAIPGFGIGRPVQPPTLDPAAAELPLASEAEAERADRTFRIAPHELVLASGPELRLSIALGSPDVAASRHHGRFMLGLIGAVVAIVSAVALAVLVGGLLPR